VLEIRHCIIIRSHLGKGARFVQVQLRRGRRVWRGTVRRAGRWRVRWVCNGGARTSAARYESMDTNCSL